jgi:hypothetical protein
MQVGTAKLSAKMEQDLHCDHQRATFSPIFKPVSAAINVSTLEDAQMYFSNVAKLMRLDPREPLMFIHDVRRAKVVWTLVVNGVMAEVRRGSRGGRATSRLGVSARCFSDKWVEIKVCSGSPPSQAGNPHTVSFPTHTGGIRLTACVAVMPHSPPTPSAALQANLVIKYNTTMQDAVQGVHPKNGEFSLRIRREVAQAGVEQLRGALDTLGKAMQVKRGQGKGEERWGGEVTEQGGAGGTCVCGGRASPVGPEGQCRWALLGWHVPIPRDHPDMVG